jgi:hypothetical protein
MSSSSGALTCNPPLQDCGAATCTDVTSDAANCGTCGQACTGSALCCNSTCVETATCAFSVTQASPAFGWQNGGDYITLTGTGFVKGMKAFIADGRAAVRVTSPTTMLLKTPPGPLGPQDITIQNGANKAVLQGIFNYKSAGLTTPWQQKKMTVVRGEDPGLAVLQDGRVLVAGGTLVPDSTADALDTAEIYTRSTDAVTLAAGTMSTTRWQNSAVTLMDGTALVVGGACHADLTTCNGSDPLSADLFDPTTNTFSPTKTKLNTARVYTRAALLPDGRALIASANSPDFEVYDPDLQTFTTIPNTGSAKPHVFGFMVILRDGRAMIGAGDGTNVTVDIFDPDSNAVTVGSPLVQGRSMLTAHTLPDGRVFVIGGSSVSAGAVTDPLDSIEAWDPVAGTFSTLPYKLGIGRTWQASALVRDGTMLVAGGYTLHGSCSSLVATVDQIDPIAGTSTPFAVLPNANTEWTAVTLQDGSVAAVGGGACGTNMALPDIDFLPGAPTQN